ncbi:MAG: NADH-quinone oxidoreductase subunit N [Isosphaeraceae bacterium]|jgi:NADH-quinone oxidoreductase subunit N|nr:MAG: NADH-quinone oxidoreductase subunit N [Isosphaeraceae bacterium]
MTPAEFLTISRQTFLALAPEILLLIAAIVMMTSGAFVRRSRDLWAALAATALIAAIALLCLSPAGSPPPYASVIANDALAAWSRLGLLLTGLILIALAHNQVDDHRAPEFFGALLIVFAGAACVTAANELIFLFVGLELVSIPTYLLLYLPRRNPTTQEAVTKYFYLSIFSSALLLFGLAYLYGLTGLSNLKALAYLIHWNNAALQLPQPTFAVIALVFILAGLGFRVAAVPFHFYAPDVYQGSPTVLAALLAWVPKAIGFVALVRVLAATFGWQPVAAEVSGLSSISDRATLLTAILAIATMTLGNTVALAQDNLKRLLAYSSIAHAGYLLIGLAAAFRNGPEASQAVLGADGIIFYLATYALMTLGAFGVILALDAPSRPVERVDDLAGLARTQPWATLALTLCLLSLAGIPPLAGFWGKLRIFQSALEVARGPDRSLFLILATAGALNAAIAAYYYLRLIVLMIFRDPITTDSPPHHAPWPTILAIGACASLSLLLGILPAPLATVSRQAARSALELPPPPAPTPAQIAHATAN